MTDIEKSSNLEPLQSILSSPITPSKKSVEDEIKRLTAIYSDEEIELILRNLLAKRSGVYAPSVGEIYFPIVVTEIACRVIVNVSASLCVGDLISYLLEELNLPESTQWGHSISYQLAVRKISGEYFVLDQKPTLYDQGIQSGCDVMLIPKLEMIKQ